MFCVNTRTRDRVGLGGCNFHRNRTRQSSLPRTNRNRILGGGNSNCPRQLNKPIPHLISKVKLRGVYPREAQDQLRSCRSVLIKPDERAPPQSCFRYNQADKSNPYFTLKTISHHIKPDYVNKLLPSSYSSSKQASKEQLWFEKMAWPELTANGTH